MIKIIEINSENGSEEALAVSAYFRSNDIGSPHFISVSTPYHSGEHFRHVLDRDGEKFDIEISLECGDSQNPYSFVATECEELAAFPSRQNRDRPAARILSAFAG